MENSSVTLGVYFEVKDSELYGGEGSIGYANTNVELKVSSLESANIRNYVAEQRKGVAEMCHVDIEKVRIISKTEYEEKTDEDVNSDVEWLDI